MKAVARQIRWQMKGAQRTWEHSSLRETIILMPGETEKAAIAREISNTGGHFGAFHEFGPNKPEASSQAEPKPGPDSRVFVGARTSEVCEALLVSAGAAMPNMVVAPWQWQGHLRWRGSIRISKGTATTKRGGNSTRIQVVARAGDPTLMQETAPSTEFMVQEFDGFSTTATCASIMSCVNLYSEISASDIGWDGHLRYNTKSGGIVLLVDGCQRHSRVDSDSATTFNRCLDMWKQRETSDGPLATSSSSERPSTHLLDFTMRAAQATIQPHHQDPAPSVSTVSSESEEEDLMGDQSWAKTNEEDLFPHIFGGNAVEEFTKQMADAGVDVNTKIAGMGDENAAEAEATRLAAEEDAAAAEVAEAARKAALREKRKNISKEEKQAKIRCTQYKKKAVDAQAAGTLTDEAKYAEAMELLEQEEFVQAEAALKACLPSSDSAGEGGDTGQEPTAAADDDDSYAKSFRRCAICL